MRKALNGGLLFLLFTALFQFAASAQEAPRWSDTHPQINLTHIFEGEINKRGKATGFHHVSNPEEPQKARIQKILSGPNRLGIYTAIVEIFGPADKLWKSKFSSMFPNDVSKPTIVGLILKAFQDSEKRNAGKWRGKSGAGYFIEGYLLPNGKIVTAYPIYEADNR
ncbi:EndoU domain-containing protein [Sneathiella limimaris]|uniref:EndoU domain-containing protein n=1 Tax=Sneathiella limimaris TaxID=1964213 RepID=UPI00146DAF2C|nr:EndoU domain-containing protein [Sneathiella limimaris]